MVTRVSSAGLGSALFRFGQRVSSSVKRLTESTLSRSAGQLRELTRSAQRVDSVSSASRRESFGKVLTAVLVKF
ncbi:hypothetical protein Hdeb2414_s0004g00136201 [Helianthus debilis subsp. tardiflorus]